MAAVLASRAATMTGCRLDEVEGLLKTEVDAVGMALRLGDTKTGKSIRPVGSVVIAVVKAALAKSKSKYVFPAVTTNSKHHTGLTRWLQKIAAKEVPGLPATACAIRSVRRLRIWATRYPLSRLWSATPARA